MPPSREDADHIATLERELHRLRCEYRRVCQELNDEQVRNRVLARVIEKIAPTEESP